MSRPKSDKRAAEVQAPWWRFGIVWLVVAGPAIVVVASVATGVVAYRGADLLVIEAPSPQQRAPGPTALTPAVQARNNAATAAPP